MSFAAQIGRFTRKTATKMQRVRKGVTISLFNAVVMDTPVLEGRLRGNWRISEGSPDLTTDDRVDKTGNLVTAEVIEKVAASTGEVPVFLTNSLPYAVPIEFDGISAKAPPGGMVRTNVNRFNRLLKREIRAQ